MPCSSQNVRSLTSAGMLLYSVGELPVTITMVLTGLFLLFFYNTVLGLPALWVGIGIASGLIADAVLDPYIGFRSDASRHPLGQRHVFMLFGSLFMGPSFYLLFHPPTGFRGPALFAWLFVMSIVFRATSAIYRIPYLTLGAELADDYHERTRVMGMRAIFGLAGTLAAGVLSFVVFFRSSAKGDAKLIAANYHGLGLVFGAVMTLSGLAAYYGTRSHRRSGTGDTSVRWSQFLSDFRTAMQNHAFRHIWIACTLFFMAVVLNASLSLQFFTWAAGVKDSGTISKIQGAFYIGALLGVAALMTILRRGDKRNLFIVSTLLVGGLLIAAPFVVQPDHNSGHQQAIKLIAGYCTAGIFASAVWVLPSSMIADATDADDYDTGRRRNGFFFGFMNFGEKLAAGGALFLSGALLHYFVRLVPALPTQSHDAVLRMGVAYGVIPGLILAIAAVALVPYRLNGSAVSAIQESLNLRQEKTGNA